MDIRRQNIFRIESIFAFGVAAVVILPSLNIAPDYFTFIHPTRPEIFVSILTLAVCAWHLNKLARREYSGNIGSRETQFIIVPLVLFCGWSSLSVFWGKSASSVAHHTGLWLCYVATYVTARQILRSHEAIKLSVILLAIAAFIFSFPIIIEYHWLMAVGEPPSLGLRSSRFTELLNTVLPLFVAMFVTQKGRLAVLAFAAVMVVALADIASQSRTALIVLAFVIGGMTISGFALKQYASLRRRLVLVASGVIVTASISFAFSYLVSDQIPIVERVRAKATTLSSQTRPFFGAIALEMFSANPVAGVGADNFGQQFHRYRQRYVESNPDDPNHVIGEAEIAERAHNEYLQILSELGIVGALIFAVFLLGILFFVSRIAISGFDVNFVCVAAFFGVAAFLISSLATSYSFRLASNGILFFVVLAVAVETSRRMGLSDEVKSLPSRSLLYLICIAGLFGAGMLLYLSVYRLTAVHYQLAAVKEESPDAAEFLLQKAISLDPENANLYATFGLVLLTNERSAEAPPYFRNAIDLARSTSIDYSTLAASQIINGDLDAALATIDEGISIYPESFFLRVRRSVILSDLGRSEDSNLEFEKAKAIDEPQSTSWRNFLLYGGRIASIRASEGQLPPLMDLVPKPAVYSVKAERELRFPEEKFQIPKE